MVYLLGADVFIDLARQNQGAADYLDSLPEDWTISTVTAIEYLTGAKNNREVEELDLFVSSFDVIDLSETMGLISYSLMKQYSLSHSLRLLDSLIAAWAIENNLVLVTRNEKHFKFIPNLKFEIPAY